MANSNGRITAPVRIADLRTVLNSNLTDLGAIITAGTYNRWSKYKPVVLAKVDTTGEWDASLSDDGTNDKWKNVVDPWIRGNPNDNERAYGWQPHFNTAPLTALLPYHNDQTGRNGWVPQNVTGSVSSPFRLADFASYFHNAPTPPETLSCDEEIVVPTNNTVGITIAPTYIKRTDEDSILRLRNYVTAKDILKACWGRLATVYEGFALVDETFQNVMTLTTSTTITITRDNIGSSAGLLHDGSKYWVCPIYCDRTYVAFDPISNVGNIATYPLMKPVLMKVTTTSTEVIPGVVASITAEYTLDGYITGSFELKDTSGGSRTINNVTVVIKNSQGTTIRNVSFGNIYLSSSNSPQTRPFNEFVGTNYNTVTVSLYGGIGGGGGDLLRGPVTAFMQQ